jgi:hypothetical protein
MLCFLYLCLTACFIIFDVDGDGFISVDDMNKVMNLLVGNNMSPLTVSEVIRRTMDTADIDKDGSISFDDFCQVRSRCVCLLHTFQGYTGTDHDAAMHLPHCHGLDASMWCIILFLFVTVQSCALVPWDALTVPLKSSSRHEVEVALAQNASLGKPALAHDFS